MYKQTLLMTLIATLTLFSGCKDSPEACAQDVTMNLDRENFQAVIDVLENNQTCDGALTQDEAWMQVGAAYIGVAGVSVGSILTSISNIDPNQGMAGLLAAFDSASTTSGLNALSRAQKVYGYVTAGVDCTATNLTPFQEAGCLYGSIANTLKSAGVLNAVMGDAVSLIGQSITTDGPDDVNNNGTADELEVTACAIKDASVTNGSNTSCTNENTITFTDSSSATFTDPASSNTFTYVPRTFSVNDVNSNNGGAATFYRMMDQASAIKSAVTTSGLCTTSFTTCYAVNYSASPACYPCPVITDGSAVSVTTGLLDVINNGGLDGLDGNNSSSLTSAMDGNSDGVVSDAELAAYISGL